jgi:hypothetical protein
LEHISVSARNLPPFVVFVFENGLWKRIYFSFENYVHDTLNISTKRRQISLGGDRGNFTNVSECWGKGEGAFKKKRESELKPFSGFITVA